MPSKRRLVSIVLICLVALGLAAALSVAMSDALAWRARVIRAKLAGDLPELPMIDLLRWLAPHSPVYLGTLAQNPNVHAGIRNLLPANHKTDVGAQLFGKHCAECHGDNAKGKAGPDLVSLVGNDTDWEFFSAVRWGRPGTAMAAQPLTESEIWEAHAFLRQLALQGARASVGPDSAAPQVSVEPAGILESSKRPNEWLTFAGNYAGHRHSGLSEISRKNVQHLQVAWVAQLRSRSAYLEASPIIAASVAYVTESPEGVVALDAATGRRIWDFRRPIPAGVRLCCGSANRGVAILEDSVFVTTLDAHLIALDASTGQKKWDIAVADYRSGYSMTGAPLAVGDRVFVGVAGGEFGIRGFVAAYQASDGRPLWKFSTVPGPGEFGHDSWPGDSWKVGGAPTWTAGAYDPELRLLYWGVGNPAPAFRKSERAGANLFSNSVVALDADTGKLRWYYQFTPGDDHDWDAVQQPVLAEIVWHGAPRSALLWANRNGFYYAFDRKTGEFLLATPFAKQSWNAGFERDGRPILDPKASASRQGSLVWPAVGGATNWWPPSYDAGRRLMYVPAVDAASIYFTSKTDDVENAEGQLLGSTAEFAANQPASASIKALDSATGKVRWEAVLHRGPDTLRNVGGVLSTAGGLVFAGHRDEFFALDSDSGRMLWQMRVGGHINAPPVAYAIGRSQFIAVMAGNSLFAFSLPRRGERPGRAQSSGR